jgi:ketosteroid isomerase-like protein
MGGNLESIRRAYDAFNRGDFDEAITLCHPEVEFLPPGHGPSYRGVESLRRWMEPDALVDQSFELLDFVVSGDRILAKQRVIARGASSGLEIDAISWAVWTFDEDGLLIRLDGFLEHDEAKAREAAGL